jgi:predicted Zn-dependent protease
MAYCQAQLYAQYMLATYGDDALAKMLAAYGDYLDTQAALARSFGVGQEEFEKGYLEFVEGIVDELPSPSGGEEKSLSDLVRAHEAAPENVEIASELAAAHLDRKAYADARRLVDKVLAENPRHELAVYVRARLHLLVGETEEAVALLQGAAEAESLSEPRLVNVLGALWLRDRQFDKAIAMYKRLAEEQPANREWTKSLVRAFLLAGDEDELAPLLEKLAAWDPDDATVRKKLARMAKERGDHRGVLQWAGEVLHVDVADLEAHRLLAEAHAAVHDDRMAADECEAALSLAPDDAELWLALAQARVRLGEPDKARRAVEEHLKRTDDKSRGQKLLESLDE